VKAEATAKAAKTLTAQQVKKVVSEINKLAFETVERGMLAIGLLVLEKVFQGILEAVYSSNPYKSKTLQQVCSDVDLRVDRRRLGEWVRAAALSKELIAKKVDCSNLSYSHFAALLKVDDEKSRKKLATDANKGQWSARKLADEIGKTKVAKVTDGKAQEPGQSSDDQANKLLEILGNPQALMQDEETKNLLANPQDMRHKVALSTALRLADSLDSLIANMKGSLNLLELAKKNIPLAFMPTPQVDAGQVIDVEATVV